MSQTADVLARAGFGHRSRVAIMLPNGPEMAVALLSVMCCTTCVPLDPDAGDDTLREVCKRTRAEAVVIADDASRRLYAMARALGLATIVLSTSAAAPAGTFALTCLAARAATNLRFAESGDIAVVLNTSGTTGRAKLVPLSQKDLFDCALHRAECFRIGARDRALSVAPLFTASGIRRNLLPPLAGGGSTICAQECNSERMVEWLSELSPTFLAATPAIYRALLDALERQGDASRHVLRFLMSASTGMAPELQLRLEARLGVPVIQTYAMTEVSGIAHNPLPPGERRTGSVGLAARGEIAIRGDDGKFLESGNTGEIVVRGPQVFAGYEDDEDANREAFAGGWFRTGDLGHIDADGYLYIVGRAKEIINRGGFKVSPSEVDMLLLRHAAIADAGTFGIAHATLGEDVIAAVVLRDDISVTPQELRDFAFAGLAKFKVPTRIVPVDRIPKTPLGKVRRRDLANAFGDLPRPAYVEPRNERERDVAGLFSEVLGIGTVGVHDNFFSLGGDSLRATQVVTHVNARFACALAAPTLFRRPTVIEFVEAIDETLRGSDVFVAPPIVALPRREPGQYASETTA
jgi:acyl-CoA synthetase (AMP-forming)/AMP-acid ligase II